MSATSRSRQGGVGATLAVAVIAVVAVLAVAAVVLSAAQHVTFAADVQGAKAYQAARSGIEWGAHHVLRAGPLECADLSGGVTFSYGGNLSGFHATVTCSETLHEDPSAVRVFSVTVTGCNMLAAGRCDPSATPSASAYAERQLRATFGSN